MALYKDEIIQKELLAFEESKKKKKAKKGEEFEFNESNVIIFI
jgi:hypothetical protein